MLRAKYVNNDINIYIEAVEEVHISSYQYTDRGGGSYQIYKHEAEPSVYTSDDINQTPRFVYYF